MYDRFAPSIYGYIYRRVGEQRQAEDLTSEVFLEALAALRKGRFAKTSLSAWLYRIAHNRVVDHYRSQHKEILPLGEWLPAPDNVPHEVERRHQQAWLREALHSLTDDQQKVLTLRFGEGMSAVETARALSKTEGAVCSLQHRALVALRRLAQEEVP